MVRNMANSTPPRRLAWRGWNVRDGQLIGPFSLEPWPAGRCAVRCSDAFPSDRRRVGLYAFPVIAAAAMTIGACQVIALVEIINAREVVDLLEFDVERADGTTRVESVHVDVLIGDDMRIRHLLVDHTAELTDPGLAAIPVTRYTAEVLTAERIVDCLDAVERLGLAELNAAELELHDVAREVASDHSHAASGWHRYG